MSGGNGLGLDGELMGLRHRKLPFEGVQFHPQLLFTASGRQTVGQLAGKVNERQRTSGPVDRPLVLGRHRHPRYTRRLDSYALSWCQSVKAEVS